MTISEFDFDEAESMLSLTSSEVYVRIAIAPADLSRLSEVDATSWVDRRSLPLGRCLGNSVFWCLGDDGFVTILIGEDDETWGLWLRVDTDAVQRIAALGHSGE